LVVRYRWAMLRWRVILFLPLFLLVALAGNLRADSASDPITGRVVKVLVLLMDTNSAVAPSPSLFDRDAYQAYLLAHTNDISGVRLDVCWSARHARGTNLKLRVELKGIGANGIPTQSILEQTITPRLFHHWTSLTLDGQDYKHFGVLGAWRATLWNGGQLLGEQESFLWSPP
jgi:hypothetical protein